MFELSIIIITKNEQANIRRCLESVRWADEIIIFDSGSDDGTVEICKEYTEQIYQTDWPGYGQQKNRALSKANKDWVLSLDADEQVSTELAEAIKTVIHDSNSSDGYAINRPVVFANRIIKYACATECTVRLFKRNKGCFTDDIVHEKLNIDGRIGRLEQPIFHYSFADISTILMKMNKYTTLVAQQRAEKGKKGSIVKAISAALWMFIKVYLIKRGFLDGRIGFVLAVSFAEGAYYRYVKLAFQNS